MTIAGKQYQFIGCECIDTLGQVIKIPDGIHSVAEADYVSIMILPSIITISSEEFNKLKMNKKAIKV